MDGSRRYSKVYCKTQAGAEALTARRGALSSSARQLLILLDGERDFDELERIFGEETLYRLLALLESQGLVEPSSERTAAQDEPLAPSTTTRTVIPTFSPTTVPAAAPTVTRVAAPTVTQAVAAPVPQSQPLPAQAPARSRRFLPVRVAILVCLAAAAAIVTWVFERQQEAAENPQQAKDAPQPAASTVIAGKQPSSSANSIAPSTGVRTAQNDSSARSSETSRPPVSAAPGSAGQALTSSAEVSAPTGSTSSPVVLRGEASLQLGLNSSKPATRQSAAQSNETNTRSAQRDTVASASMPDVSKQSAPAAKAPPVDSGARVAARSNEATDLASVSPKGPPTQSESSSAARKGVLALAAPDHATAQGSAPAPAVTGLHVRTRVLPTISKRALESGIYGGKALVRLHVSTTGAVERVELVSATPPEVYGPDVQQALEQWTFEPPSNPAQFTLELDFREQPPAPPPTASKPPEGP